MARYDGDRNGRGILIFGAGRAGTAFLREIRQNPLLGYRPIGFIDDSRDLWGHEVNGVSVLGGIEALDDLIRLHRAREVVLTSGKVTPERVHRAAEACAAYGIPLRRFRFTLDEVHAEAESDSLPTTVETIQDNTATAGK
jgi:FlaA1/EpsC-like NDP-sugar epimerase